MQGITYHTSLDLAAGTVSAWLDGNKVGYLKWSNYGTLSGNAGEIIEVAVDKGLQRNGIATRMLEKARETDSRIHHSGQRTLKGQVWAMAVRQPDEKLPHWCPMPEFEVTFSQSTKV